VYHSCVAESQGISHAAQAALHAPDAQANVAGDSKPLRLMVKGHALTPQLLATPQLLHFGNVPSNEWADQLLQLANGCSKLPMYVVCKRAAPYFAADPPELLLPPDTAASILIRYMPKVCTTGHSSAAC